MTRACLDMMAGSLDPAALEREVEYLESTGTRAVCPSDPDYPEFLKNIYDPPRVLYLRGELRPEDTDAVAIVGARNCTLYGARMAEKLGFDLAERGVTVVSGMARGIDTAAHRGALKAGGRTIAVMGSGFRHIYPAGSEGLAGQIASSGAVITEYTSGTWPSKITFPKRNRIVSGMSKGVVVVEAARKSGAMITVRLALDQGREVFAVPGRADARYSGGTNRLIQEGAKLVMNADDILEDLDIRKRLPDRRDLFPGEETGGPGGEESAVAAAMGARGTHLDTISETSGVAPERLAEVLLRMRMKGLVEQLPGGNYRIKRKEVNAN